MRNVTVDNASASTAKVIIEELLSERGWARGMATRPSSASTTSSQTESWKTAVPTAVMRRILPGILKVPGRARVYRSAGTIVRETRRVSESVTGQWREIPIRSNLPPGQAQTERNGADDISRHSVVEPRGVSNQVDTRGLEQPAVQQRLYQRVRAQG